MSLARAVLLARPRSAIPILRNRRFSSEDNALDHHEAAETIEYPPEGSRLSNSTHRTLTNVLLRFLVDVLEKQSDTVSSSYRILEICASSARGRLSHALDCDVRNPSGRVAATQHEAPCVGPGRVGGDRKS